MEPGVFGLLKLKLHLEDNCTEVIPFQIGGLTVQGDMEPKSRSPERERVRKPCSDDFSKCTGMEHLGWKLSQEIKLESFRGMQQPWKTQWQDFLKTLPCPHVGWEEDSEMLSSVPWDDPKAFLASFEQVARACQWPRGEWVPRLLPALSGEAKRAFSGLEAKDKEDYGKVKEAILRGEAIRIEVQRQHFRQFRFQEIEDPRRVYGQLQRLCRQWLKPERHTKEQILELLILEQFLASLPPELQSWIRPGGSDTYSQAAALIENFLLNRQEVKEPSQEVIAKTALSEERIALDVDQEAIYKDIKQDNHGGIHLLGEEMPRIKAGSSIMGVGRWDLVKLKDAGVSLNVVGSTPTQSGQQTMFWQVMQEEDGDADSLEGLLVPKPDLASNPEEEEDEQVFIRFPVESERIPDPRTGPRDSSFSEAAPSPSGGTRFSRKTSCPLRDFTGSHWKHPRWTEDEIQAFIEIWGDTSVQRALFSNYRTVSQFEWISCQMKARGYDRNWLQCREKAKHLRKSYKDCLGGHSHWGSGRRTWPFFNQLNQFLRVEQELVVPREIGRKEVQHHLVDRRRKRVKNSASPGAKVAQVQVEIEARELQSKKQAKHASRLSNGTSRSGSHKPPLTSAERMRNIRKSQQERTADVGRDRGGIEDSAAGSALQEPALPGSHKANLAPSSEIEKAWEECERKAVEKLQGYLREKGWKLQTGHSSRTGILQDVLSIVCKGRTAASLPVLTSPVRDPPSFPSPTPRSETSTESQVSAEPCKNSEASSPPPPPPPPLPPPPPSSQGGLSDRSIRLKRKRSLPARFQC
ncbi:uncharacterized protein LOC113450237 [Pseudonaja textilis]|uniref:uncharacterized protein LOC113450237 n=1 Tax=Pseudonaja textilis TaxID=8673 RepID=UPI000EA95EF9|nr:uncharacterized protein LOC113450237 [Pseudonaja textilis]